MTVSSILSALRECENDQNNNLIGVLAIIKPSRTSSNDAHVASIVRGLCTQNSKLRAMLLTSINDVASDPESAMDIFKLFANDFILWFDIGFVVFEKFLECFPIDGDSASLEKPLIHCGCYPAFADSAIAIIRNPFVVDKLTECKARTQALLEKYAAYNDQLRLNNISFDRIRAISGDNVSCYFTLNQIVDRTRNEPLYWGYKKVEFLLLNLQNEKKVTASDIPYNALAVVSVPEDDTARSVLFPPFRLNELSMSRSENMIKFTPPALFDDTELKSESFTVEAREDLLQGWYEKLARIFPTTTKLVSSQDLNLEGLGINTVSDNSECDSRSVSTQESASGPSTTLDDCERLSEESRRGSFEIMKKTLSHNGIATTEQGKSLEVVSASQVRNSVRGNIEYVDDESVIDDYLSDDCATGFEIVNSATAPVMAQPAVPRIQPLASASLPDLSVSVKPPKPMYLNAAGIDINNFGRSYNPSFTSIDELPQSRKNSKLKGSEGAARSRSSSIFGLFRKNKSKEALHEDTTAAAKTKASKTDKKIHASLSRAEQKKRDKDHNAQEKQKATVEKGSAEQKMTSNKKSLAAKRPELSIEVPKIGAGASSSQPLSATSSNFASTLPLPFALPNSTSTYFFKPPTGLASNNNSTTSLAVPEIEEVLKIPNELKSLINSDESIDFYISPTTSKELKVSKWKQKYGKWEMITTNEKLFVKIVTNYLLHKSWLLVFKEEYDEEYGEEVDKPVLILNIDSAAKVRHSSALDLEINSVNSITNERVLVIARCYNGALLTSLKMNLENILEVMNTDPSLKKSATFDSNNTLASSMMSNKPSASSTLTSIYTALNDVKQTPCSTAPSLPNDEIVHDGDMVLLDRATVRLHKQQESYDEIHRLSSWKTINMYSLSIHHSTDSFDRASYHFSLDCHDKSVEEDNEHFEFSFDEATIFNFIEQIGKAALLLKVSNEEIYMLECKGKKEFKRLYELF